MCYAKCRARTLHLFLFDEYRYRRAAWLFDYSRPITGIGNLLVRRSRGHRHSSKRQKPGSAIL